MSSCTCTWKAMSSNICSFAWSWPCTLARMWIFALALGAAVGRDGGGVCWQGVMYAVSLQLVLPSQLTLLTEQLLCNCSPLLALHGKYFTFTMLCWILWLWYRLIAVLVVVYQNVKCGQNIIAGLPCNAGNCNVPCVLLQWLTTNQISFETPCMGTYWYSGACTTCWT